MNGSEGTRKIAKRIRFRLDDGSIIGDAQRLGCDGHPGAVKLAVNEALQRQLAGEAELSRLQKLLASPDLPEANGHAVQNGPPAKKPRLESKPSLGPGVSLTPDEWIPKGKELIGKVQQHLGTTADWFLYPVNVKEVPDYYRVIKNPICFSQILDQLDKGVYNSPNELHADVTLLWKNCKTYNKRGTPVWAAGDKGEKKWDELWDSAGLSTERTKRATAGVAAAKFEPTTEQLPKPKTSGKGGPTQSGKKAAKQNGAGRAASHEVTSGGRARGEKALTQERRVEIADQLQGALSDGTLGEEHYQELMALLPEKAIHIDADGETELDFEAVDDTSLRQLDAWLRSIKGEPLFNSPSQAYSGGPSVRLDADDDDDDDYHSD